MKNIIVIAALIGALTLTGCATTDASEPIEEDVKASASAEPAEEEAEEPTPSPEPVAEPDGTRDRPYAAGTQSLLTPASAWTVGFQPSNLDATAVLMAENSYNEIIDGRVPVLAPITVGFNEGGGQDLSAGAYIWESLTYEFVTAGGRAYTVFGGDACEIYPESIFDVGTVYPGASVTANVCAQVPADEIAGGLWSVSNSVGDKLFFTTQ